MKPMVRDVRSQLRQLYRDVDGFIIPADDERKVDQSRASAVYGELMPTATLHLFEYLKLTKNDVLYDLGSGVGKVVLFAAMAAPLKKCVGIELSSTRHSRAMSVLRQAKAESLIAAKECSFVQGDIMKAQLVDATVIYTCATAFPYSFTERLVRRLAKLTPGLRLISLQGLDPDPRFQEIDKLRLDTTWRRGAPAYVYRLGSTRAR